jgi:Dolichyl-phosphate-mannose-protein mannosyltransferase
VSEKINRSIERFGERKILLVIAAVVLMMQLDNLHTPSFFGEPYLVAKNIVAGKGFVFEYPLTGKVLPSCYVTPLYVYLQVPFLYFGIGERGIQIMNLLFLQAACFVLYRFFRRFAAPGVALLIFTAISFYIPFWILSYTLDPNSLNILFLALTVDLLYVLSTTPSIRGWMQLGFLVGLQMLLRPDILLGAVLFAAWILFWNRSKDTWKGIGIAILISLAIVSPWTLRNYIMFQKFVLVSANSGMNLFEGNNPVATGEFSAKPPTDESKQEFAEITEYANTHDAIDLDKYRFELAEQWILDHPSEAFKLDLKKVWYHWFGRPIMGEQFHYQYQGMATAFRIGSGLMLLFGMYGLYCIRDNKLRSLLLVVFFYSTLVSAIFFVQSRHRILKVDPFLLPLAVMGVTTLYSTVIARRNHAAKRSDSDEAIPEIASSSLRDSLQ